MMREIKFRAWNSEIEEMHFSSNEILFDKREFYPWGFRIGTSGFPESGWVFMQFTGRKDKKGTPIYEGDIIECEYFGGLPSTKDLKSLTWRGIVEYFENHTHFSVMTKDGHSYSVGYSGSSVKRWEVIGNIHQNPEML